MGWWFWGQILGKRLHSEDLFSDSEEEDSSFIVCDANTTATEPATAD